jgi:glycosyltransferase involved in cell wall biosynthesis
MSIRRSQIVDVCPPAATAELTGDYLAWVGGDDALAPTALEGTAAILDSRPDVGLVYTQYLTMSDSGIIGNVGRRCRVPYSKERLLTDFMTFQFRLLRRSVFDQISGLDESAFPAEDYDLCLRLSEMTEFAYVPEPLYFYRVHEDAISRLNQVAQVEAGRKVIERALERRGLADTLEVDVEIDSHFQLCQRVATAPSTVATKLAATQLDLTVMSHPEPGAPSSVVDVGLVSCLCVTRGGHRHVQRALKCFQAQTYPNLELIVVYETLDDKSRELLSQRLPGITLVHVPSNPKQPLGTLRNVSVAAANGSFLCGWDDDDWHAPQRIELQPRQLLRTNADACVLSRWLMLDETSGHAYASRMRLWEGSLLCRRDLEVVREGYLPLPRGEDRAFVDRLRSRHRLTILDRPELYVYTCHGNNAWGHDHFQQFYSTSSILNAEDTERVLRLVASPDR